MTCSACAPLPLLYPPPVPTTPYSDLDAHPGDQEEGGVFFITVPPCSAMAPDSEFVCRPAPHETQLPRHTGHGLPYAQLRQDA